MSVERPDVELVLARHTVRRAIWVVPPLVLIFGLVSGWLGAGSALIGGAVVVGNFLLAGAMLSVAARISLPMYHATALFGFFLRLGLVLVAMILLIRFVPLDRAAFGIAAVVSYMVLLAWEAVAVSKGSERKLEWIQ